MIISINFFSRRQRTIDVKLLTLGAVYVIRVAKCRVYICKHTICPIVVEYYYCAMNWKSSYYYLTKNPRYNQIILFKFTCYSIITEI